MAECKYTYKGHTFNSELELDDFLLAGGPVLYKELGDIVFQKGDGGNAVAAAVSTISSIAAEASSIKSERVTYFDEEGEIRYKKPHAGVTEFLKDLQINGGLVSPTFHEENYWPNRFKEWNNSEIGFNADERKQFGDVPPTEPVSTEELHKFLIEYENAQINHKKLPEPTNETLKVVKQVKDKWVAQGQLGTEVHDVLRFCFSGVTGTDSKYKGIPRIQVPNHRALILNQVGRKFKTLSKEQVESVINYAEKLDKHLRSDKGFGPNIKYFPELKMTTQLPQMTNDIEGLIGMVDLTVLDDKGYVHIIDYKLSPKDEFNKAKELTFYYQQGLYAQMLKIKGLSFNEAEDRRVMIAPIRFDNFRQEGENWIFDTISARDGDQKLLLDITKETQSGKVAENIETVLPSPIHVNVAPEKVIEYTTKFAEKAFPGTTTSKTLNDEEVKQTIERWGGIKQDSSSGKYYIENGRGKRFESDRNEQDIYDQVKKYYNEILPKLKLQQLNSVKSNLTKGIRENTSDLDWNPTRNTANFGESPEWLKKTLGKYCNSEEYEVINNPSLDEFGIIAIENKITKQVDFIQVVSNNLDNLKKLGNNQLLTASVHDDQIEARNANSLALKSYEGNIQLMEVMSVINCMPDLVKKPGATIGEIMVMNPADAQGMSASNEELVYNFSKIADSIEDFPNIIPDIKFASKSQLAFNRFKHIMSFASSDDEARSKNIRFSRFKTLHADLEDAITSDDNERALDALQQLRISLENNFNAEIKPKSEVFDESQELARSLYNRVLIAIADLNGVKFRQQVKDNKQWVESMAIHKNGFQSLLLDNPGRLNNDTLNLLTKLCTQAYQNVRETVSKDAVEIRKAVEKLKKAKGFSKFEEYTTGNQSDLYHNMIDWSISGDLRFKNPEDMSNDLTTEEREFLSFALKQINKNRLPAGSNFKQMIANNDPDYFRVPLCKGGQASAASYMGSSFQGLKYKLRRMNPKAWYEDAQKALVGVFSDKEEVRASQDLFKMNNQFEHGKNANYRKEVLEERDDQKFGKQYFENNIETILLKHTFAYSMQEEIDKIMPMAKASMVHLMVQGQLGNKSFGNATNYISDYIRHNIKGEDITNPEYRDANAKLGMIKSAASKLALAFSPMLYPGQLIQGLWNDLRLIIQNIGTENATFTFENFRSAFVDVYSEMFRWGKKPTKCKLLNEFFGFNDMDMNQYADKIKSDDAGIFNFWGLAFHGASKPDFYNRMMLFVAQMKHDGTWDAYSVDSNGALKYDWKKDARFAKFVANSKGTDAETLKQKALYIAMARDLVRESARNKNGQLFKLNLSNPEPLPKAYTNAQIESFKSLSDDIYGYYSHEKKAMIHATTMGALWMQMRTYWSGKKNQYLGAPGIALRGDYKQQVNSKGQELFLVEEDGKLIPKTAEEAGDAPKIPMMKWEGDWQEGVLATLSKMNYHPTKFSELFDEKDENLRHLYQSNMRLLLFDIFMLAVGGALIGGCMADWDKLLQKEAKDSGDLGDALIASAAHIAMKSVNYSFLDFNMFESIGGPMVEWNAMSLSYLTSRASDAMAVATGDKSFKSALANMSAVTGQFKPLVNFIFQ